jgi:RND family efflux transporter MFP subunit
MKKWKKIIIQSLLVVAILVMALVVAKALTSFRKPPEKKPQVISAPLLNAVAVFPESFRMTTQGFGSVKPRMKVQVVPQVSGKVIQCHPQLVNGGFFEADEPLVVIEQTDYKLAVESASAAVAQAQVQLEREKAEADVAKREWEKLKPGQQPDSVLVFRGPQIRNAQAQLNAAQAQLAKAKLDLERTAIRMPFNGRVVSTNIDVGQFVTIGAPIATVYRTDIVEIVVPFEDTELAWFEIPLNGNSKKAATADIYGNFAGAEHHWTGQLVRTEGQIDAKSRMVHVVAQVRDPLETKGDQPPLVPGMFVRVEIQGKQVKDIFRIPRYAIRNGDTVWLARPVHSDSDGVESGLMKLAIVPIQVMRMDRTRAYVNRGLQEGDYVITSPLETVADGMAIRINTAPPSTSEQE